MTARWLSLGLATSITKIKRFVYIYDFDTEKILHKLGGHIGCVNEGVFNVRNDLIASASSDRTVIIGELPLVNL